jgi:hypothetical protein
MIEKLELEKSELREMLKSKKNVENQTTEKVKTVL